MYTTGGDGGRRGVLEVDSDGVEWG